MDWSSYFLGLATLPALIALALAARALVLRIGRLRRGKLADRNAISALEFTPRLVGQIRRPAEPGEESAKAS